MERTHITGTTDSVHCFNYLSPCGCNCTHCWKSAFPEEYPDTSGAHCRYCDHPWGEPTLPVEEELELELDLIESIWMDPECIQYWTASGNYPRGDSRWLPPATRARARVAHTRERSD